jgi:nucleotide-binding universal stress UspA family protein
MSTVMTRGPARPLPGDDPERTASDPQRPAAATAPPGRIVVGVDDSPAGVAALRWAVGQARSGGRQLVAVRSWALGLPRHGGRRRGRMGPLHPHIVLYFDGTEQRDACATLIRRSFRRAAGGVPRDVAVTVQTPEGDPGAALTSIADAGDMIVLGRGEPGLRRVLHGSVSGYCRRHSRCPVVVVPARQHAA